MQLSLHGIFPELPEEPALSESWWPALGDSTQDCAAAALDPASSQPAALLRAGSSQPSTSGSQEPVRPGLTEQAGVEPAAAGTGAEAPEEDLQLMLEAQPALGSAGELPELREASSSASETEASDSDSELAPSDAVFCTNCTRRVRDDFCEASRLKLATRWFLYPAGAVQQAGRLCVAQAPQPVALSLLSESLASLSTTLCAELSARRGRQRRPVRALAEPASTQWS